MSWVAACAVMFFMVLSPVHGEEGPISIDLLNALLEGGPRFPGEAGHARASQIIERHLRDLDAGDLTVHEMQQVVPEVAAAYMVVGNGRQVPLYPVWPNGARLSTTPVEGIGGSLIYVGFGHETQLPARSIAGSIVAMEYNCFDRWKQAFELGAAAVLFLPPKQTSWVQSHAKFADIAFHAPRFYLEDAAMARAIRAGVPEEPVRIISHMHWAPTTIRNFIWTLDGTDPALRDQVVVLTARYDASSVVPQLAYGAEQAISAAVLCELAVDLARHRPRRTTVLLWTGADSFNFASLRAILGASVGSLTSTMALETKLKDLSEIKRLVEQDLSTALAAHVGVRGRFTTQVKHRLVQIRKRLTADRRAEGRDQKTTPKNSALFEQSELHSLLIALQRDLVQDAHLPAMERLNELVLAQIEAETADTQRHLARRHLETRHVKPLINRNRVVGILALEITSQGPAFGVYGRTHLTAPNWAMADLSGVLSRLGQRLVGRHTNGKEVSTVNRGMLTDTFDGRRDWRSDIVCPLGTATDVALHFGYLSLAFITAQDGRWLVDSPLDRRVRLNMDHIRQQVVPLREMVQRATNDEHFYLSNRIAVSVTSIKGQAVVRSPGDARLNLGQPGRLVAVNIVRPTPRLVGTRRLSVQHTSATGAYQFEHLSHTSATGGLYTVDVFGLDEEGRIVEAANQAEGLQAYLFRNPVHLAGLIIGVKSVMFDCVMEGIAGLRDPRYVQDLRGVRPLLYRPGKDDYDSISIQPRSFAMRSSDSLASVALPPDERWLASISRGQRGLRMLMIGADARRPKGSGFACGAADPPVRSAVMNSAQDLYYLNQSRLDNLARFGITGRLTDSLQSLTQQHLNQARVGYDQDRAAETLSNWRAALGLQQIVYSHVLRTGDDVVMALIVLLIVLMPFSFYLERLLVNAATIYGRITGFVIIFLFMMGMLYTFHPAFQISVTPIVVLLAFVIIVLSAIVIFILFIRFSQQLHQGTDNTHSTSLSRLNVIGRAMVVGVANMRRRKIRTAFTLATLVVMTFALLALSGTRTEMAPKHFALDLQPTYPGLMVMRVGWDPMPAWFIEQVESAYTDLATVGGQYWLIEQADTPFATHVVVQPDDANSRGNYLLRAVMGVGPMESQFHRLDSHGKDLFMRLAQDREGCLLPAAAAATLSVSVGDRIRIRGRPLRVSGVFTNDLISQLRYLNGQPYGPIDLKGEKQMRRPLTVTPQTEEQMLGFQYLQADQALKPLAAHEFAIIRSEVARDMGASLHSICMRSDDAQVIEQIAKDLSVQRLLPVYHARGDGVELIATRAGLSVVGLGDLIIPLLIGALIIVNTMLNAVSDQRATIHVYTSLGLAPMHVGVMFLSEAAALGTLGVVGGFIFGQGFATTMRAGDFLDALTLNFSSTAVVFTMGLVMAIVLLSALYPASMASRLAAPAESMRWELPAPVGDEMSMALPFSVSELTANGIPAFLHEWLSLHTESGVGAFISDQTTVYHHDRDVRSVQAQIWLAPFDVGVYQQVQIELMPTAVSGLADGSAPLYEVHVRIGRHNGQRTAWLRSNRAFISELRKQFLLWRSLSNQRQQDYVAQWQALLTDSPN